jgi:hypothetical protein
MLIRNGILSGGAERSFGRSSGRPITQTLCTDRRIELQRDRPCPYRRVSVSLGTRPQSTKHPISPPGSGVLAPGGPYPPWSTRRTFTSPGFTIDPRLTRGIASAAGLERQRFAASPRTWMPPTPGPAGPSRRSPGRGEGGRSVRRAAAGAARCADETGSPTGCSRLTRMNAVCLTLVSRVGFAGRAGSAAIWDRCRRPKGGSRHRVRFPSTPGTYQAHE